MPLSPPLSRQHLHTRQISFDGYRRDDGLWEVDGELKDFKPVAWLSPEKGILPPGAPVHHMLSRLTVDDSFVVQAIEASMDGRPFPECGAAIPGLQQLVGVSLLSGWRKAIEARIGGICGCTHMRDLLTMMATAVYQTTADARRIARENSAELASKPPGHFGKCISWDFDGPVIARLYPQFHRWNDKTTK